LLLIGDDDVLLPGALSLIISHIISDDYGIVYLNSYAFKNNYIEGLESKKFKKNKNKYNMSVYKNYNEFIYDINLMHTFISGNIINKELVDKDIDSENLFSSGVIQFYWIISAALNAKKNLHIHDYCVAAKAENTGGYSVCSVFGVHLITALEYFKGKGLSDRVDRKFRKIILGDFLPLFIVRQKSNKGKFSNDDFLKLLRPIHNKNLYFWLVTVPVIKLPVALANFWHRKTVKIIKLIDKVFDNKKKQHKKENGFFLKLKGKFDKRIRKIYNFWLNRSIRKFQGRSCKGLLVHPSAKITGLAHMKIGDNFVAGEHLRLEAISRYDGCRYAPEIVIKNNVCLNDFVHIGAVNYVEIGNDVLMASKIYISDHNHGTYSGRMQSDPAEVPSVRLLTSNKQVIIGDRVWIGEFVSILPGVTIGEGSIVAANAVVTKDVPPGCIVAGAPARIVKRYDPATAQWCGLSVAG